jgi:mRNA interferase RelE/StbE
MMVSGRDRYRPRQGNYRVLYTVEDRVLIVQVVKFGHRRNVYR